MVKRHPDASCRLSVTLGSRVATRMLPMAPQPVGS
jgi:hypothetical protein